MYEILVRINKPKKGKEDEFKKYEFEGYSVYVEKNLEAYEEIIIRKNKYTSDMNDREIIVKGFRRRDG